MAQITELLYWWDSLDEEWYVQVMNGERVMYDSGDWLFPVDVRNYAEDMQDMLELELKAEYPGIMISYLDDQTYVRQEGESS